MKMCPVPTGNGGDCWGTPHPDSRQGLCTEHWREIAVTWYEARPFRHFRCEHCNQLNIQRDRADNMGFCTNPQCRRATEIPTSEEEALRVAAVEQEARQAANRAVVYYLRWADRIKIGTSTNLPGRLRSLYHDECLAVERGGIKVERQRHRQFEAARIPNQLEWFRATPELVSHINDMRRANGEPLTAAERWSKEVAHAA